MSGPARRPSTFGFRDRLRYRFDSLLSRGVIAVIGWVGVIMAIVVTTAGLVLALFDADVNDGKRGFAEALWQEGLRVLDPGTMGGDAGTVFRAVSITVTLSGIFLASVLIGLITNGIGDKVEDLRKGRSKVVEEDHTVILGWSPKVFALVDQLCIANESRNGKTGACVVVLAPLEKVTMEDDLRAKVPDTRGTRVVCRHGDPTNPADLTMANVASARSVVVLTSGDRAGDAEVVTTVLALRTLFEDLHSLSVIADLSEEDIARELHTATDGGVLTVVGSEWVARIAAQASRQAGLSLVYQELSQFEGSELYFHEEPSLVGATFGDAVLAYDTSAVLGIRSAGGDTILLPPIDRAIDRGDQLIVVAEDDSLIRPDGTKPGAAAAITVTPAAADEATRQGFLIIGWNELGPSMLSELDAFLAAGSPIEVVVDPEHVDPATIDGGGYRNLRLRTHEMSGIEPARLEEFFRGDPVDHVVVLGYKDQLSTAEADARTMLTLLHLHRLLHGASGPTDHRSVSVVAELLEIRNVDLAKHTAADDFVVGDGLASLVLAQLTEQPGLHAVFSDLLGAGGTEISLRHPSTLGVAPGATTTFGELVRASMARGELAFGIRTGSTVTLSPRKTDKLTLGEDASVIVLVHERLDRAPV